MRSIYVVVLFVVTALLCRGIGACSAQPPSSDAWAPLTSEKGRFTASLPGTPTLTTSHDSTPVGEITEYTYTLDTPSETYTINYQDLPTLAVMFGGSGRIYSGARDGFLKDAGGTAISFTQIVADAHHGRQLLYQAPASGSKPAQQGRMQMFLVRHRLYVVAVSWPQGASSANADRFLNSFKIIK